jgi:hypothetical protein
MSTARYNAGSSAGYSSGYSDGNSAGYSSGYNAGVTAGSSGKSNVVVLPSQSSGSSWYIPNYCSSWGSLSTSNFHIGPTYISVTHSGYAWMALNVNLSYDSSTGYLSVSMSITKERDEDGWSYSSSGIAPVLVW